MTWTKRNKLIFSALGILIAGVLYWHMDHSRHSGEPVAFTGLVTLNSQDDIDSELIFYRPGNTDLVVRYQESGIPPCIRDRSIAAIEAGTVVSVWGRYERHVASEYAPEYDLVDVCRPPDAHVIVEPITALLKTDFCSLSLRKAVPALDKVCGRAEHGENPTDLGSLYQALGDTYAKGESVPKDYTEAAKWYGLSV